MKYAVKYASRRVEKERAQLVVQCPAIANVIEFLSLNPRPKEYDFGSVNRCNHIKKIKFKSFRIFYIIDDLTLEITIGKIEKRASHSYGDQIDPRTWFKKTA